MTPQGETLALRLVLATARRDPRAVLLVHKEMTAQIMAAQIHPADVINELATIAASFAAAAGALGFVEAFTGASSPAIDRDPERAVEVIEHMMTMVLDLRDDE